MKFIFAWYDFWVGFFYNKKKRQLYIFPIPMVGIMWQFGNRKGHLPDVSDIFANQEFNKGSKEDAACQFHVRREQ